MLLTDKSFPANYELQALEELPGGTKAPRLYFPVAESVGGRDGAMVSVIPLEADTGPWIGIFAFGLIAPLARSGIFTCPNPDQFCVIARGAGYIVTARNPKVYEHVAIEPVLATYAVPSVNLRVFAGFTHLAGYGPRGVAWRSENLSWDGLRVDEIDEHELRGKGWSAPENRWVDFEVDLRTGLHKGGAAPS